MQQTFCLKLAFQEIRGVFLEALRPCMTTSERTKEVDKEVTYSSRISSEDERKLKSA